jgi:hypothetical protein
MRTYEDLIANRVDVPTAIKLFAAGEIDEATAQKHSDHSARFFKRIAALIPKDRPGATVGEVLTDGDLDREWREAI